MLKRKNANVENPEGEKIKILFSSLFFILLISTTFAQEKFSAKDAKYLGQTILFADFNLFYKQKKF